MTKTKTGENFTKPVRSVRYSKLTPVGDGYKRRCPVCTDGILLVRRDQKTFEILMDDNCILCGQRVRYVDGVE